MKSPFTIFVNKALLLIITFAIYSGTSFFSKCASNYLMLSVPYILYFGCVLFFLFVYAILWQKVLSIFPLNKAFLYKSSTIIMILCISHFVFNESITVNNLLGVILIISGLCFLSWEK